MSDPARKFDFSFNRERSALLICIGIAFLVWMFIKLSKDYETTREVFIEYTLPPLMEFSETPPNSLIATLHGAGVDLAKKFIFSPSPSIQVNVSEFPDMEVSRSNILLKIQDELGVSVRDINLDYIRFVIDSTSTKKVPVVLDLDLNFRRDFFLKNPITLSADSVILAGPQQLLQLIDKVQTQHFACDDVFEDEYRIVAINTQGLDNIEVVPPKIQIEIQVEQFTEKTLDVPIRVVNSKDSVQVLPSHVELKCAVGMSKYDSLKAEDFIVEADIGSVVQLGGQKSVPVYLKSSPEWVKSPRMATKVVEYLIVK